MQLGSIHTPCTHFPTLKLPPPITFHALSYWRSFYKILQHLTKSKVHLKFNTCTFNDQLYKALKKLLTWDSRRMWAPCDSHDFQPRYLFTTFFIFGFMQMLLVQNFTIVLDTSIDRTSSFLFALSLKAQRTFHARFKT